MRHTVHLAATHQSVQPVTSIPKPRPLYIQFLLPHQPAYPEPDQERGYEYEPVIEGQVKLICCETPEDVSKAVIPAYADVSIFSGQEPQHDFDIQTVMNPAKMLQK